MSINIELLIMDRLYTMRHREQFAEKVLVATGIAKEFDLDEQAVFDSLESTKRDGVFKSGAVYWQRRFNMLEWGRRPGDGSFRILDRKGRAQLHKYLRRKI